MFIADIMSAQLKVKEIGAGGVLVALCIFAVWAYNEIETVKQVQPDKRLAVIETTVTEMDKKIDRLDNRTQARFDRLEAKMDRMLER